MTVRRDDNGVIVLTVSALSKMPSRFYRCCRQRRPLISIGRACRQLHTAVLQLVLASGKFPIGPCGDAWVAQWLAPKLTQNEAAR